jgi:RNA polymerase II subunit A small phosphatase-like protein
MDLMKLIFASKQNSEASKGAFSLFSPKFKLSRPKKLKKVANFDQVSTRESMSPVSPKTPEELASKFSDLTWGLAYKEDKKTLILDLDNTLIYASKEIPETLNFTSVVFERNGEYSVRYVIKRPGILKFLKKLSKLYNICVFTSAEENYAKKIIEATKISKYIYTLYDRSYCEKINASFYVKNIWTLGFKQMRALLIDDLAMQAEHQPENCILIKPFNGEDCDRELYNLYPILSKLSHADDVRLFQKMVLEQKNESCQKDCIQTEECGEAEDCAVDLDEGCYKACIRTFECRPKMMIVSNGMVLKNAC